MPSESREVREKQLKVAEAELAAFKKTLGENVTEKVALKNAVYRQLRAELKRARMRIVSMDKAVAHVEAMKQKDTKAEKTQKQKKVDVAPAPQSKPAAQKGSKKKK